MRTRNIIIGSGVAVALALAVVGFTVMGPPQPVSALQLAQNSAAALEHMKWTPQQAEYKKFYPYFVEWLQQAQQAPDLRVLTYDELVKAYPAETGKEPSTINEPLRVIDNPSDGKTPDIHELTYLEFTAKFDDGKSTYKVVVGINSDNIPEAAFTHFIDGPMEPRIGG